MGYPHARHWSACKCLCARLIANCPTASTPHITDARCAPPALGAAAWAEVAASPLSTGKAADADAADAEGAPPPPPPPCAAGGKACAALLDGLGLALRLMAGSALTTSKPARQSAVAWVRPNLGFRVAERASAAAAGHGRHIVHRAAGRGGPRLALRLAVSSVLAAWLQRASLHATSALSAWSRTHRPTCQTLAGRGVPQLCIRQPERGGHPRRQSCPSPPRRQPRTRSMPARSRRCRRRPDAPRAAPAGRCSHYRLIRLKHSWRIVTGFAAAWQIVPGLKGSSRTLEPGRVSFDMRVPAPTQDSWGQVFGHSQVRHLHARSLSVGQQRAVDGRSAAQQALELRRRALVLGLQLQAPQPPRISATWQVAVHTQSTDKLAQVLHTMHVTQVWRPLYGASPAHHKSAPSALCACASQLVPCRNGKKDSSEPS